MGRPFKYHTEEEKRIGRNLREQKRLSKDPVEIIKYRKEYYEKNKTKILEQKKQYHIDNRQKRIEYTKNWTLNNKEKSIESHKNWILNNKEKYKETRRLGEKRRRNESNIYRFYSNIRSFIRASFIRNTRYFNKYLKSEIILGCSLEKFKEYILSKCPEGTTLKDFGRYGYHIDHIIPVSLGTTEEDIIRLCHYTNLQPLWWRDNILKSNKIIDNEHLFKLF